MEGKIIAFIIAGVVVGAGIGVGIGFAAFNKTTDETTYYFYVDFGDNSADTGWYSAKAANADKAIEKAFDGKDFFKWSGGYPAFSDGYWGVYCYTYSEFTKLAAEKSAMYPQYYNDWQTGDPTNNLIKSNGWEEFAGYNETDTGDEPKLHQSSSTVWYFSSYAAMRSVAQNTAWMTANGTPFATA